VETDSLVDMQVAVAEGEDQYVEAVGELHEDGLDGQSADGMPPEAGDGRNGPPPEGAAGVDVHFEQVVGTARSQILLDPRWAPCQDLWKPVPCKLSGIRSLRLRFLCNLCL